MTESVAAISRQILAERCEGFESALVTAEGDVVFETARNGLLTGRYENVTLCSAYDPLSEAESFCRAQPITQESHVLLYGVGLGYHLPVLLDLLGERGRLVVAEGNNALVAAALKIVDPAIWRDARLRLVMAPEEQSFLTKLSSEMNRLDPDRVVVAIHSPSYQAAPEKYTRMKAALELILMERRFPRQMGGDQKENRQRNIEKLFDSGGVGQFDGIGVGCAGVVVGAGPTLDRDIVWLLPFASQGVIISSDTALPALIRGGVRPDIVVSVDPKPASALHFIMAGDEARTIPLVVTPSSSYEVIDSWRGPLYFFLPPPLGLHDDVAHWYARTGVLLSGGSVSCFALELAHRMGVEKITLIGQDFSVLGNQSYASDTAIYHLNKEFDQEMSAAQDPNYFGRPVSSPLSLYSYRRSFEELVEQGDAPVETMAASAPRLAGVAAVCRPGLIGDRGPTLPAPRPVPLSDMLREQVREALFNPEGFDRG